MENDEVKWAKGDLLSVANDALIAEKLTVYLDIIKDRKLMIYTLVSGIRKPENDVIVFFP